MNETDKTSILTEIKKLLTGSECILEENQYAARDGRFYRNFLCSPDSMPMNPSPDSSESESAHTSESERQK